VRNKKSLTNVVGDMVNTHSLGEFFSASSSSASKTSSSSATKTRKLVVIMDEVDGMSGNSDRGGMQELLKIIKNSKTPISRWCYRLLS
jgi:hypothetical protein